MNTPAISIALILPPEFHDAIPADPIFLCSNQFETIEYHINRSSNLNSSIFTSSRLTQTQIKSKKDRKKRGNTAKSKHKWKKSYKKHKVQFTPILVLYLCTTCVTVSPLIITFWNEPLLTRLHARVRKLLVECEP